MAEVASKLRRLFTGRFEVTVDSQHRMVMPKAWRLKSDTEDTCFYLVPSQGRRIQIVTEERINAIYDAVERMPLADQESMEGYTDIASRIQTITLDKQGRFQLSPDLAKSAGITDRALFLGSFSCGTLVAPDYLSGRDMPSGSSFDKLRALEEASKRDRGNE